MNNLELTLSILTAEEPLIRYGGRALVYFPEVVLFIIFLWLLARGRLPMLLQGWRQLPRYIQIAALLILIGGFIGGLLAASQSTAAGALKAWFVVPLFAFLLVVSFRSGGPAARYILMTLATLQVAYGAWQMLAAQSMSRMTGSFESANFLGMLVAPAVALAVVEAVESKKKIGWIVLALFLLAGLLASRSIGGLLGLLVVGGIMLFRLQLSRMQRMILTGLLALGLIFAGSVIMQRLEKGEANSLASRVQIWETSWVLSSQQPLTGIGIGHFPQRYADTVVKVLGGPPIEWGVSLPHNIFLAFWVYTGVFGLAGLFFILAEVFKKQYGYWMLPFFVLIGHGLVDTPYFLSHAVYIFWLLLGIGIAAGRQERKSRRTESS